MMVSVPTKLIIHHSALEDAVQLPLIQKSHEAQGYPKSHLDEDSNTCYHFLVGLDGTVKQLRSLSERSGCTRNQPVNLSAIHIVVAGNFEKNPPSQVQLTALRNLITRLDAVFKFETIEGHRNASPTACPGKLLMESLSDVWRNVSKGSFYRISRYYSPEPGQMKYYHGSYLKDVEINCGLKKDGSAGDCYHTADGTDVRHVKPFSIVACPGDDPKTTEKEGFALGTKMHIDGIGEVVCRDRGGAIRGSRLDLLV